ncbi:TonB-dependent receptor [bacterium]|nr:TonB-dependent receptor [bacterium]
MKKFTGLALISLLLLSSISIAQTKNPIRGFIVDATSDEPLPAANIIIVGTVIGASTNLDGYFVLGNLESGIYTVEASYLGYHSTQQRVTVTDQLMNPLKIDLLPSAVQLEEVTVVMEDQDDLAIRQSPKVSVIPIDAGTIRKMPSLGGEMDVMRTLQLMPGVKSSSDISSALYVRGGSPDQTLILMDHNVVYNPSHLFGLFSTFNADAVKRIDLMKGGFPAEYGGRSGSVLDVITNEGNRKETEGLFSLGIISSRGALEGPLPNKIGSYAVSARRTYMEPILDYMRESQDIDLPSYYFYDANGKVNLDLTDRTTLTIAGYWGEDDLTFDGGPEDSPISVGLNWGNRTFTSRLRHALGRDAFVSFGASVSRYRSKWDIENDGVDLEDAYDRLLDYSFKSDLEFLGSQNHRIKTGVWISYYEFLLRISHAGKDFVNVDDATANYSWYVQDRWRFLPKWELQPGLRLYYHEAGELFMADPRLALVYHYRPDVRFKVAGGRYSQFIDLISFGEGMSSFDIWAPIDETMEPTYCDQLILGYEWEPNDQLEFTTETYYTQMHDVATFNMLSSSESFDGSEAYFFGEGTAYGIEFMLRKKSGRLQGWAGYTLSWTDRTYADTYLNDGETFYPKWDRRHDFIATAMYDLNNRWDMSASWRFNTGQGVTQPVGLMTTYVAGVDPDAMPSNGRQVLNGELNNYRFPEDHRLDVTATWKHTFFKYPARLNISIYNVYSRRSYWLRITDLTENPVVIEDIKLLPIVPMISYEVRF